MSLKKDKFSSLDKKYMRFAINLANNQKGLTGTNPSVGCVIVKNKEIISYGVTGIKGRPHAESIALKKNKSNILNSSLYVSLEPCSHYGKTPPCTKAIIDSKVKNVFYSIEDSDDKCFNKSKKILNSKRIFTKSGLLRIKAKKLYKNYDYIKKNKKPYVIGKIACSSNSYIYKNNKLITNDHSRKVSHLLRYKNQGILTSYKTINSDNPKLNCRINGLESFSPFKLIIDKDLKINIGSYVVKNAKLNNTIIFHNSKNVKKINILKYNNLKLIFLKSNQHGSIELTEVLKKTYEIGIHNLLVECGEFLTNKFLKEKLFNEFYLFKSSEKINSVNSISIRNIRKSLVKSFKSSKIVNTYLDKDSLIHYY